MLIYKITNIVNGKLYIGQTTKTLDERIKNHHNAFVSGKDTHLYRSMRKYGWDKFQFSVIVYASSQDVLNELEEFYIRKYDTVRNGYNMAYGGTVNVMYSESVAKKHDAKMRTKSVREKISKSMKLSYAKRGGASAEHRKHLSDNKKKFYASDRGIAAKKKFSETYRLSDEHKAALIESLKKHVDCFDSNGNLVQSFSSVKEAANWYIESVGAKISFKSACAKIKRFSIAGELLDGYLFVYRV